MKKLTLVVDDRELRTIRAALLLLQEQVDALPEDLAEMVTLDGRPMTVSEIEHLTLRLDGAAGRTPDYPRQAYPLIDRTVEIERLAGSVSPQSPA